MTTITLYRVHGGFANVPGGWSLDPTHADEYRGDYSATFRLPEGYSLGEANGGGTAVFDPTGHYCHIERHVSGRPQLVGSVRQMPVLEHADDA